jgi:galactosyl transferase GMA12/MNN10 family
VLCFFVVVVFRKQKDADTIIMNRSIALESFLPPDDSSIDLLLTEEKGRSWNAGAWLIRNSEWSLHFLDTWWNMTSFVKPKGLSTSGDNDALKHYLTEHYDALFGTTNNKIFTVPRCTFNSVAPFLSKQQQKQMSWKEIKNYFGPNSHRHYHRGDFVAHVAGINNKVKGVLEVLKDAQ